MRAAHLVPHHWGYNQVGCIFGDPNNGYNHVWSTRNGLHLYGFVEVAFDKGQVVIVPYDDSNDGQRWKVQVVDKSLLGPDEEDRLGRTTTTWSWILGELTRPGRR